MAKTVKIIKKALGTFSHLQALTVKFPIKSIAYERTDGQTRLLRSQRPVGRETKNRDAHTDERTDDRRDQKNTKTLAIILYVLVLLVLIWIDQLIDE